MVMGVRCLVIGVGCWVMGVVGTQAQQSYQVGIGRTQVLDTYLTQEKFKGTGITFLNVNEHTARNPKHSNWSTIWQHQLNLSTVKDRSEDGSELEGAYNLYIGRYRAWHLLGNHLKLQAGAMGDLGIGFIYNTRNANNPASIVLYSDTNLTCHSLEWLSVPITDSRITRCSRWATTTTTSCPPHSSRNPHSANN